MNYSALKAAINAAIKTNGNKEITGAVLNTVLNAMTTALGEGYQYAGAATPSGTPTSTDGRVFYLANGAGTYTNYGGLVVNAGELALLRYDTEWHKDSVSVGSEQVQSDWTESDSTKKSFIKNKPDLKAVATSGSYNDLTDKPAIPAKTSDLENDENFVCSEDLSAVATTGSYDDLLDKPTIPADKVAIFTPENTPQQVYAAFSEGKMCFMKIEDAGDVYYFNLVSITDDASAPNPIFAACFYKNIFTYSYDEEEGWIEEAKSIPEIATSISAASTNSWAAGAKAVYDFGETKQPKTTSEVLTYQASQTYTLTANKIATLDASAAASGDTITINLPASPAVTDCFDIQITIGANAPTINWPSGISWLGGSAPTINASKKYEINIMNGFAVAGEF